MTNPFAFIVGNPRSGTTLLRHIVDSHSQIAFLLESAWFMNWFEKRIGLNAEGLVTPELVPHLLSKHRLFRDVALGISAQQMFGWIESDPELSWAKFVTTLCNRYGQARGKPLVGNKTPSFVRRIRTMHELWPQAKFIHIIRDGRDVFLSARVKWKGKPNFRHFSTWSEDSVTTAALWWEWNVRLGREAGCLLPPDLYYEISYERLVEDPENECARLCEFLGVPFESAMLRHQENFQVRHRPDGSLINARVALPITPGLRNWRSDLGEAELERFEAAGAVLLNELGYPLGNKHLRPQSLEYALKTRKLFEGRPLPQGWHGYTLD
jgi:hypothetical protein